LSFERRRRDALQHTEPERSEGGGAVAVMRSEAKKRKISPSPLENATCFDKSLFQLYLPVASYIATQLYLVLPSVIMLRTV